MKFLVCLLIALDALRTHKLRAFLTMLGVIIGVGSVMVMISIVEGARFQVVKEFEALGSNLIFAVHIPQERETGRKRGVFKGLTMEDAEAIQRRCRLIAHVLPSMEMVARVKRGTKERRLPVMGVTADANRVLNVHLDRGRSITNDDVNKRERVCVLGQKAARKLFDSRDPIGEEVEVSGVRLKVIGLLEKKGRLLGEDRDNGVYLPLSVVHHYLLGREILTSITAKAISADKTEAAADEIWEVLRRRHDNISDVIVDTQASILKTISRVLAIFAAVLGSIGGLALLVGGIGIMNIMLVSVMERTREIGIRKTVGAKRRDILVQFLIEAMTLSGVGGLVGIGFGYGLSWLIGFVMKDKLPTHVSLPTTFLAFSVALFIGVFFGFYPAYRAAKLDPIECLRYE